jgi:D-inositol-3-phosphate glycosyltransferase
MPRVALVTHYLPPQIGGVEVAAQAFFDGYLDAGIEARWIASRVPVDAPPRDGAHNRVRCWNGLERRMGVPWPVWGVSGIRELSTLAHWADVLHVHDCLYMGSFLAAVMARRSKKPLVVSQHIGFVEYPSAILNSVERTAYATIGRAVLRSASHIVFCTPAAGEFVRALLPHSAPPSSVIPNGIDTRRFRTPSLSERERARHELGLPSKGPIVLFTGRLVEKKGIDVFVEVIKRMPSLNFLLIGDGPLRPAPATNLRWLPFVSPQRMETAYRASDAFVLPSHSEGLPMSILEAMATGLPVLTSRGQTFADDFERERACAVSERSATAFCEHITRIFETPGLAEGLGDRARALVERRYSLEAVRDSYSSLVRSLASEN